MDIEIDLAQFLDELGKLPEKARVGLETGLDLAAEKGLLRKVLEINDGKNTGTYGRIVPKRSTYGANRPRKGEYKLRKPDGPAWERKAEKGGWLGSQVIESRPGERDILTTGDAAKYEERMANLPNGPDGINRSNDAAKRTHDNLEAWGPAVIEREIARALR